MLKMTTCGWFIREGHLKDRVNIFWTNSLCEGVAVSVDAKKWIRGWKRAKGGLHNWPGVGRVQGDESVDDRQEDDASVMTDYIRVSRQLPPRQLQRSYSTIHTQTGSALFWDIGSLSMEMFLFQYSNFVLSQTILPRAEWPERIWLGGNSSVHRLST